MKVTYDKDTDTLTIVLRDVPVAESDEARPGVILDLDADGRLVAVEVLDASRALGGDAGLEVSGLVAA